MADQSPSGGAGGTVKLRFDLALLYAAEQKAKQIKAAAKDAATTIAGVKRDVLQGVRDKIREARAVKDEAAARIRRANSNIMQRARAGVSEQGIDEAGELSELSRTLRKGRKGFLDFVGNPLREVASGNPAGAVLGLAGEFGGPLIKILVALVTAQIVTLVEQKIAEEVQVRMEALSARLDEQRYQDDYQRRLEDEPDFRRAEARRAGDEMAADEDRLRASGWGRSADYLDGL